MIIRIGKRNVDVARRDCAQRSCFQLGFDKGSYTPGRGYTSYYRDAKGHTIEKPVCMTRHLHGCPINSVCPECRTCSVLAPGDACEHYGCSGTTVDYEPAEVTRG
jgi:hypothetical protein